MYYIKSLILLIFLIFMAESSFASGLSGTVSDTVSIITNIAANVTSVRSMVVAFLYLAGIGFFVKALYHLEPVFIAN